MLSEDQGQDLQVQAREDRHTVVCLRSWKAAKEGRSVGSRKAGRGALGGRPQLGASHEVCVSHQELRKPLWSLGRRRPALFSRLIFGAGLPPKVRWIIIWEAGNRRSRWLVGRVTA